MAVLSHLQIRDSVMRAIRAFFHKACYLEVETPCRLPEPMPEAAICPQPAGDWFLQTSPEVCMKRLLAAGMPRIFQICHAFRRDERGDRHLPEYTLLEWYGRDCDYQDLMRQTEALVRGVAGDLGRGKTLFYQQHRIDLSPGWPRLSVAEAFARFGPVSLATALAQDRYDEIMGTCIEPQLGWERPVFLYDYPAPEGASLARLKIGQPDLAERFELYLGGLELCNGFSELTGTAAYRQRFEQAQAESGDFYPWPEKFLQAADQMPPAAGNALGIDRLVMLFCDTTRIEEVVAFAPEQM